MAVVLDNAWLHEADMFDGLGSQFNARAGDQPNGVNVRDDPPSRSKDQRQRRASLPMIFKLAESVSKK